MNQTIISSFLLSVLFVGCSANTPNKKESRSTQTQESEDGKAKEVIHSGNVIYLQTVKDLPKCGKENFGHVYYIADSNKFLVCDQNSKYQEVDLKGIKGDSGENGDDGYNSLIRTYSEAKGPNCTSGGIRIASGLDLDRDGNLSTTEITDIAYICNGTNYEFGTGYTNTCDINNRTARCWGAMLYQSGAAQPTPPALVNPTQISGGIAYICALHDTGVKCWGESPSHRNVPSLVKPTFIEAGFRSVCALDSTGVKCWGESGDSVNTAIPALSNPKTISVGSHACAIDGSNVKCWGNTVPSLPASTMTPPTLNHPSQLSVGDHHACALDLDGVKCWGKNDFGQTTVPSLSNPAQVVAGVNFSCALADNGVTCWGKNDQGQTSVPTLNNPIKISVGHSHACALDSDGLKCWGSNYYGQTSVPQ